MCVCLLGDVVTQGKQDDLFEDCISELLSTGTQPQPQRTLPEHTHAFCLLALLSPLIQLVRLNVIMNLTMMCNNECWPLL